MTNWIVQEVDGERSRECNSRSEAEEVVTEMQSLGMDVEVISPDGHERANITEDGHVVEQGGKTDGGSNPAVIHSEVSEEDPREESVATSDALDELGKELGTDPLSILPGHMTDEIQGQLAVNKRGYSMIAERYGIDVSAEIVSYPWDNPENRCVAKAVARTDDGREYTGHATACAEDGDMAAQIIELAETRSLKRAVSWASGVGIISYAELTQEMRNNP